MNVPFGSRLCDMDICPPKNLTKAQPGSSKQWQQNKGKLVFITKDGTGRVFLCLKFLFGFMVLILQALSQIDISATFIIRKLSKFRVAGGKILVPL